MRRIVFAIICVALLLAVASCRKKQENKPEGPQPTSFEAVMTESDSTAVKKLIDVFFQHAMKKELDEAAAMIYRNDLESSGRVFPLSEEEYNGVKKTLQVFSPIGYSIEYIKFNTYKKNEVLCNVVMSKSPDGRPLVTTKMFFKPVKTLGTWYLCLMDSGNGDKGVVKPADRDSLKRVYRAKEAQKAASAGAEE